MKLKKNMHFLFGSKLFANYQQTELAGKELSLVNMVRGDFNKLQNLGIFLYNSRFLLSFYVTVNLFPSRMIKAIQSIRTFLLLLFA